MKEQPLLPQDPVALQRHKEVMECIDKAMWLTVFDYPLLSPGGYAVFSILLFALPFLWDVGMTLYAALSTSTLYFDGCIRNTNPRQSTLLPYLSCVACNHGSNHIVVATKSVDTYKGLFIYFGLALYLVMQRYALRSLQNTACGKLLGYGLYICPNSSGVWRTFIPIGLIVSASAIWNLIVVIALRRDRTENVLLPCGTMIAMFDSSNPAIKPTNSGMEFVSNIIPYIPITFSLFKLLDNPHKNLSMEKLYRKGIGDESLAKLISSSLRWEMDAKNLPNFPEEEYWDRWTVKRILFMFTPIVLWKWIRLQNDEAAMMELFLALKRKYASPYGATLRSLNARGESGCDNDYTKNNDIEEYVKSSIKLTFCGRTVCGAKVSQAYSLLFFLLPLVYQMLSVIPFSGGKAPNSFYDGCTYREANDVSLPYPVCYRSNSNSSYVDVPGEPMGVSTIVSIALNASVAAAIFCVYVHFRLQGRQSELLLPYGIFVHYTHTRKRKMLLGVISLVLTGLAVLQCLIAFNVRSHTRSSSPRLGPYYATFNPDNPVNNFLLDLSSPVDYMRFVFGTVTSYLAVVFPVAVVVGKTYSEMNVPSLFGALECCTPPESDDTPLPGQVLEKHIKYEIRHGNLYKCIDSYLQKKFPTMSGISRTWNNVTFLTLWGDSHDLREILANAKIRRCQYPGRLHQQQPRQQQQQQQQQLLRYHIEVPIACEYDLDADDDEDAEMTIAEQQAHSVAPPPMVDYSYNGAIRRPSSLYYPGPSTATITQQPFLNVPYETITQMIRKEEEDTKRRYRHLYYPTLQQWSNPNWRYGENF